MRYEIFGPFPLPRDTNGLIASDRKSKANFWDSVEERCEGLSSACGCYVFMISAGKGALPWYIGLAEKQSFRGECFQLHKKERYKDALMRRKRVRKGTPQLYLIPKLTPSDRFAKPSANGHRATRLLENLLIGVALAKNPNVTNIKGTSLLRRMEVPGFLNVKAGKLVPAKSLRATLNRKTPRAAKSRQKQR